MIVVDTSALLAFFNAGERTHAEVARILHDEDDPPIVPPLVLAELDFLLATRIGVAAEVAALREVASGGWELPAFDEHDLRDAADLVDRYADQDIGLADASIVVLAHRYGTQRVATLDRRRFGVVRPLAGGHFQVVP